MVLNVSLFHISNGSPLIDIQPLKLTSFALMVLTKRSHLLGNPFSPWTTTKFLARMASSSEGQKKTALPSPKGFMVGIKPRCNSLTNGNLSCKHLYKDLSNHIWQLCSNWAMGIDSTPVFWWYRIKKTDGLRGSYHGALVFSWGWEWNGWGALVLWSGYVEVSALRFLKGWTSGQVKFVG